MTEKDPRFLKWKEEGRLIPICPEVFGGLPTPRPDSQRIGDTVQTGEGVDVTKEYTLGAEEALRLAKENDVAFAIMKQDSRPAAANSSMTGLSPTRKRRTGSGSGISEKRRIQKSFAEEDLDEAEKVSGRNRKIR